MPSRGVVVVWLTLFAFTQLVGPPRVGGGPPVEGLKASDDPLDALCRKQNYRAVPLLLTTNGMHLVKVALDGKPFLLMVDTGGGVQIALGKEAGAKLGIKPDTQKSDPGGTLVGPGITAYNYGLGSVRLVTLCDADYRVPHPHTVHVFEGISGKETLESASGVAKEVVVDGVLGQQFLRDHSAIVDTERSVLYLQPLVVKELPKLRGQWDCIWGERNGEPLAKAEDCHLTISDDRPSEIHLDGRGGSGYLFMSYAGSRKRVWSPSSDKTVPGDLIRGICEVSGDRLKLCVLDESRKEAADPTWADAHYPTKFEAKTDSGHVYYLFKRKPADPPKK